MYDGVPLLVKWVTVEVTDDGTHLLQPGIIDTLRLNRGWSKIIGSDLYQ